MMEVIMSNLTFSQKATMLFVMNYSFRPENPAIHQWYRGALEREEAIAGNDLSTSVHVISGHDLMCAHIM